jgi:hypothetical protein
MNIDEVLTLSPDERQGYALARVRYHRWWELADSEFNNDPARLAAKATCDALIEQATLRCKAKIEENPDCEEFERDVRHDIMCKILRDYELGSAMQAARTKRRKKLDLASKEFEDNPFVQKYNNLINEARAEFVSTEESCEALIEQAKIEFSENYYVELYEERILEAELEHKSAMRNAATIYESAIQGADQDATAIALTAYNVKIAQIEQELQDKRNQIKQLSDNNPIVQNALKVHEGKIAEAKRILNLAQTRLDDQIAQIEGRLERINGELDGDLDLVVDCNDQDFVVDDDDLDLIADQTEEVRQIVQDNQVSTDHDWMDDFIEDENNNSQDALATTPEDDDIVADIAAMCEIPELPIAAFSGFTPPNGEEEDDDIAADIAAMCEIPELPFDFNIAAFSGFTPPNGEEADLNTPVDQDETSVEAVVVEENLGGSGSTSEPIGTEEIENFDGEQPPIIPEADILPILNAELELVDTELSTEPITTPDSPERFAITTEQPVENFINPGMRVEVVSDEGESKSYEKSTIINPPEGSALIKKAATNLIDSGDTLASSILALEEEYIKSHLLNVREVVEEAGTTALPVRRFGI